MSWLAGLHELSQRRLGIRLAVASLLTTALLALIVGAAVIYIDFQQQKAAARLRFAQIESSYVPSLTKNLWEVNEAGVRELLKGIVQLPDVGAVTLIDDIGVQFIQTSDRAVSAEHIFDEKTLLLQQNLSSGDSFNLGSLTITLVDTDISAKVQARSRQIGSILLLALAANATILLFFLRRMVIRHLFRIAKFTSQFNINQPGSELTLGRPDCADELSVVVNALNALHHQLRAEFTQRQQTEIQLRDYQNTLQELVEERTFAFKASASQLAVAAHVAGLGVWSMKAPFKYATWNERMYELYGLPFEPEKKISMVTWAGQLHEEDQSQLAQLLQTTEEGKTCELTLRIVDGDGNIRYLLNKSQTLWGEQGQPAAFIGVNYDISEQVLKEHSLQQSKAQAEAENAAKSSFLANMSHEIRTPLNAVLGMLHLVQNTGLNPRQYSFITKAHASAKLLLSLLNDILDYSKIESGKLTLDSHDFSLNALLSELAMVLMGNRGDKNVEIIFAVDQQLPDALVGDALRLKQILINLAGNALKFTQQGHVLIRLNMLARIGGVVEVYCAVEDTGIGISPEQQARIFDGFTQAESSITRRFGGTGLGLVISKKLVALMGGELKITSQLGAGSCFHFTVALKHGDAPAHTALPPAKKITLQTLDGRPAKILIVEDNKMSREVLRAILAPYRGTYKEAETSALAMQEILTAQGQQQPFDVVLMDWHLPDGDGLHLAECIRALDITNAPRIIMLSGFESELLSSGHPEDKAIFNEYLIKPVTPWQLLTCIERVLSTSEPAGLPHAAQAHQHASEQRLAGLRLLVVDDNALNREVAQEMLWDEGAQVDVAAGGQEGAAMALQANPPYDAILMDMQMPEVDGLQATRIIRADMAGEALIIIAMTANASKADRDLCIAVGMDDHLGKPIDLEILVAKICQFTRQPEPSGEKTITQLDTIPVVQQQVEIENTDSILRRFGGKPERFKKLLDLFARDARDKILEIGFHAEHQNLVGCMAALHSLKGMALSMGAAQFGQQCATYEEQINNAIAQGCAASVEPMVKKLDQLYELSLQKLGQLQFAS